MQFILPANTIAISELLDQNKTLEEICKELNFLPSTVLTHMALLSKKDETLFLGLSVPNYKLSTPYKLKKGSRVTNRSDKLTMFNNGVFLKSKKVDYKPTKVDHQKKVDNIPPKKVDNISPKKVDNIPPKKVDNNWRCMKLVNDAPPKKVDNIPFQNDLVSRWLDRDDSDDDKNDDDDNDN
jgi:hypothetical protein